MCGGDIPDDIAERVSMNVGKPDAVKLRGNPLRAGFFAEGWSRNSDEFGLAVNQSLGVVVQPGKRGMHGALRGKCRNTGEGRAARENWHGSFRVAGMK